MYRCKKCKYRFRYVYKIKSLFSKNKPLECPKCGEKYIQTDTSLKMAFYISIATYIIFEQKVCNLLDFWIYSSVLKELLTIAIGIIFIFLCIFLAGSFSRLKKINRNT